MRNEPGTIVHRRQDYAYKNGDGCCTLALVTEPNGQPAVYWYTYHLDTRRRFQRATLRAAEQRYLALRDEVEHYGLRPTKL